jgi:hypothetical protein
MICAIQNEMLNLAGTIEFRILPEKLQKSWNPKNNIKICNLENDSADGSNSNRNGR